MERTVEMTLIDEIASLRRLSNRQEVAALKLENRAMHALLVSFQPCMIPQDKQMFRFWNGYTFVNQRR